MVQWLEGTMTEVLASAPSATTHVEHWTDNETAVGQFELLPIELIQLIASLLPPSSAVAFTICNHHLRCIIGNRHISELRSCGREERQRFLQALDRDLPNALFCHVCCRIHTFRTRANCKLNAQQLFDKISKVPCFCPSQFASMTEPIRNAQIEKVYHSKFLFEHVAMAMKLHRSGRSIAADEYCRLLRLEDPFSCILCKHPLVRGLYYFEPRIIGNVMVIRTQVWTKANCFEFPTRKQVIYPCFHRGEWLYSRGGGSPSPANCTSTDRVPSNQDPFSRKPASQPALVSRCKFCHVEMQSFARLFGAAEHAFVATAWTTWRILGDGLSRGGLWSAAWNFRFSKPSHPQGQGAYLGSIRDLYESQEGHAFDSDVNDDIIWERLRDDD